MQKTEKEKRMQNFSVFPVWGQARVDFKGKVLEIGFNYIIPKLNFVPIKKLAKKILEKHFLTKHTTRKWKKVEKPKFLAKWAKFLILEFFHFFVVCLVINFFSTISLANF